METLAGPLVSAFIEAAAARGVREESLLEVLQVDNARRQGWSWQEIADALGVSKQAVHKKHGGRDRRGRD